MEWIYDSWPWYIAGPIIALVMMALTLFSQSFGFSSNLRTICTIVGAGKNTDFFNFNWKSQIWNLVFLLGAVIGGFLSISFLSSGDTSISLNPQTVESLTNLGFEEVGTSFLPQSIFGIEALQSFSGILFLIVGGFLVGFGSRYAGGCTSGHAISGLSNLQLPSLIAVIGFFIGGLLMTHLILPLIL